MKILKRQQMLWRIRIESEDDLWVISKLARKGKSIAMLGDRRDQTTAGETGGRAKKAERKKMWIRLRIENSEYQTFSETLRIHNNGSIISNDWFIQDLACSRSLFSCNR